MNYPFKSHDKTAIALFYGRLNSVKSRTHKNKTRAHDMSAQTVSRAQKTILVREHFCTASAQNTIRMQKCALARTAPSKRSLDPLYALSAAQPLLARQVDFWDFGGGDQMSDVSAPVIDTQAYHLFKAAIRKLKNAAFGGHIPR